MTKNYTTIKTDILAGLERRKKLISTKCVPFEYEIFKSHGDCMGNILMNQMTPNAIILMHQDKEHKMPNTNLWISPENRINNKVCITNASAYDKLKATSHEGILKIGEGIEKKMAKKQLLQLQKALTNNSEFERFECEKRIKFALQAQQDYYKGKVNKLVEKFNDKFKLQKEILQNHYQKKCTKIVKNIMNDCCYSISNALAMERNKFKCCTCTKRPKLKSKKKIRTINQFTSCTNIEIPELPKNVQSKDLFNNKSLCNMMHFVLCGEKLDNLKVMNNMKKNYSKELNNIKINLFKIIENITSDIQQPPLTAIRNTENSLHSESKLICYNECFDILCCLKRKINNIVMCLDNRIASLNVGCQQQNIINTCNVIVPQNVVTNVFCDCVSSSLDTSTTESASSNGFDFPDFNSPNVKWNKTNITPSNLICKCGRKTEISDISSSIERSSINLDCLSDENKKVPAIKDVHVCSSTSSNQELN